MAFDADVPDATVTIPQLVGKIIVNMPCAYITEVDQANSYVDVDDIQQSVRIEGRL